jgi:hypothetical protein
MRNCGMGQMPMYPMPGMQVMPGMQTMPGMQSGYNNESSLREELNKLEARVSRLEGMVQVPHNESNFYMV